MASRPDIALRVADVGAPLARPPSVTEVLGRIFQETAGEAGRDFFRALVRGLAVTLRVRYAFAAAVLRTPPGWRGERAHVAGKVHTLAGWNGDAFTDDLEYDLAGSPCERVIAGETCEYRRGVAAQFPRNEIFARMGVEAYIGVALVDPTGAPIGVLTLLHDWPMDAEADAPAARADPDAPDVEEDDRSFLADEPAAAGAASFSLAREVLRACAAGASAELVRLHREEAIRHSEARYQALAESSAVGIWQITHPDGRTRYMNPAMRRMLELDEGDDLAATDEPYHRFFTPESIERARPEHAKRAEGISSTYEVDLVGRRGRRVSVLISGVPVHGPGGALEGMIGTFTDITERKRAEEALRASEQRLRILAEQAPAILWTADTNLNYTSGVGGGLKQFDLPQNAYLGTNVREIFGAQPRGPLVGPPELDGSAAINAHERALAGEPQAYEQAWGGRYFQSHVEPLRAADGSITGVIGVSFDITDRQRADAELRRQKELLQTIFDHIPVMVALNGAGGQIEMVNREFTRVLGWNLEDLRTRDLLAECYPDPEQRRRVLEVIRAADSRWVDMKTRVRDGRVVDTAWVNVRLRGGAILGIGQDITDRKRVEDELRESKFWLETRVRDRTAELSAANERLRLEIEQRRGAEDELRQSQQRYASILNSQQTLVSRSDPSGRITYQNAAHQRVFGNRVGESVLARVHPDDIETTEWAMSELKNPPHTCSLEQRCEVGGKWRTFLWQGGVVRDRHGMVIEYQGVGFDITDRRRAEEMLRESMQHARDVAGEARASADRERRAADEAREVAEFNRRLALEVDHRVRNNLAGLLSLVGAMRDQSKDVRSFAGSIEGRLLAMTHVHQVLAETDWRAVDLKALVTSLMDAGARLCRHPTKPLVGGASVAISPRQTPPLSMILMEWFTNSCKYGAHTLPTGRVTVTWELVSRETPENIAARFVRLRWLESGGPAVRAPGAPSLGTQLVQGFAKLELKGTCELRFPPGGADHLLEFPVEG